MVDDRKVPRLISRTEYVTESFADLRHVIYATRKTTFSK